MNFLKEIDLEKIKKIHMVGIGGSSMSGLAQLLHDLNFNVSGSDKSSTPVLPLLEAKGIKTFCGHSADNLDPSCDLLVYSSAVDSENPEIKKSLSLNIPVINRAEAIGLILPKFKNVIGISGMHGKSTTSSLITGILWHAGLKPSFNMGCVVDEIKDESPSQGTDYFVLESCEYKDNFHNFCCSIGIILNIELEHVDYFKNIEQIKNSFYIFAQKIRSGGTLIACSDDENIREILKRDLKANIVTYGIYDENADITAKNITYDRYGHPSYTLYKNGEPVCDIDLNLQGKHNILNSLAAIGACMELGLDITWIRDNISGVKGAKKRMEYIGSVGNTEIFEDYGHHPTEIKTTLEGAKMTGKKVICIFQPHTYSRTREMMDDMAHSLLYADKIYITDIWASRENDPGDVHSTQLAAKINQIEKKCVYCPDYTEIARLLKEDLIGASGETIILYMGAGDIGKAARLLVS